MPEKVTVDTRSILSAIHTLKSMADSGKVTGYENMDKLVGLVILFQNILAQATAQPMQIVREGDE